MVVSVPARRTEHADQQPSPYHHHQYHDQHHRFESTTQAVDQIAIKQEYQPQNQFHHAGYFDESFQKHYQEYLHVVTDDRPKDNLDNPNSLSTKDYCEMFTKISENPSLYKCKLCEKTVTNRWHHASIHRPQYSKCPKCQQTFTRKDNMKAHMRLKHGMFRPVVV